MPTPSEQKALAFVAIVILLGGAVRVLRAGSTPAPTSAEQQGIAHQARAADSAARAQANKPKGRTKGRKPRGADTLATNIGGVSSVPPSFSRPDQPYAKSPYGYPPPGPRIDVDNRSAPSVADASGRAVAGKVNLDTASAAAIEKLPLIGPALARRIVANRDSLGPFKTLAALHRVKGMGPKILERLGPLVTFGGR